jgi:hypothetical protein
MTLNKSCTLVLEKPLLNSYIKYIAEVKMKKILLVLVLSFALINACFSITWIEKLLLPEFHGDLSNVPHKVIEDSSDVIVVEIDGVLYIVKAN